MKGLWDCGPRTTGQQDSGPGRAAEKFAPCPATPPNLHVNENVTGSFLRSLCFPRVKSSLSFLDGPALDLLRRFFKFCVVGGSGVFVDMGVLWLLASPSTLAWNLSASKLIAAEVAILNNFAWNDQWTFRGFASHNDWRSRLVRLGKFNAICLAGIGLSVLLLNAQIYGLGMNMYLANFCAIVIVSGWNFYLNLRFGWSRPLQLSAGPVVGPPIHANER
jgi:putative flippase GtrA